MAFLPNNEFIQSSRDENLLLTKLPQDWTNDLNAYRFPPEGDLDELPEIYKNSNQIFKLDSNIITLINSSNIEDNQIRIERKDTDDGEVEVSTYIGPHYAGGVDFTRLVLPPKIILEKGMLSIQAPTQQNLEFKRFDAGFTVNQFEQVKQNSGEMNSAHIGWKVVYIRVPKNLEIINSVGYNVQMVK